MKKIFLCILLLVSITCLYSQNLEFVKTKLPTFYEPIKASAEQKWNTDYDMVKYDIEKQCDALVKYFDYYGKYKDIDQAKADICIESYIKWTETINDVNYTDWTMVVYEVEKQLKAFSSY